MVQLVGDQSTLTPAIRSSNPVVGNSFGCQLYKEDENTEKRERELAKPENTHSFRLQLLCLLCSIHNTFTRLAKSKPVKQ